MSDFDDHCQPWTLPDVEGLGPVTVDQLEAVQEDAYAEAFETGRQEGLEKGYREGQTRIESELRPIVERFRELAIAMAEPLERVDEEVEESLVELAMTVARQLVLRELRLEPALVVDVVRQAMGSLPLASRGLRIFLHPHDVSMVREALDIEMEEGNLRLAEDPGLTPGGCRVQTDVSSIDASVEGRLQTVITQVLGGERGDGAEGDDGSMTANLPRPDRCDRWQRRLDPYLKRARNPRPPVVEGKLVRMVGLTLEAAGCQAAVGDRCHIVRARGADVVTEVVGFSADRLLLMPIGEVRGLAPGARVVPVGRGGQVSVGNGLLGRVLDGTGRPIDGRGPLDAPERVPLAGRLLNPLARRPIRSPLDVGVRSINALLTVGRGQRLGLFAGSGVGKSVLLGMMAKFTDADVTVVGMIGERGREVNEFITNILGPEGLARSVVVAAPADAPPLVRLQGAAVATAIAEFFRDQGRQVLLLMDSLTRFAQAQREVGLAVGEPPATRGYPPSVFARLPELVERAGNGDREGGITAIYTVLRESDDPDDPIADAARAILDGHVVLSRGLAEQGHYPAIDVETSISRAMNGITVPEHQVMARRFRQLYTAYSKNADIINVGAYVAGSDPQVDEAIVMRPRLLEFLQQDAGSRVELAASLAALGALTPTMRART